MASYAFVMPIVAGKTQTWKGYVAEMVGPRSAAYKESRRKAGLEKEEVWLQSTPMGDFAVVHFECADPAKIFATLLSSQDPFDQWFREKVLIESHGLDPSGPPPPINETISLGP